jgi:hypothetical protein
MKILISACLLIVCSALAQAQNSLIAENVHTTTRTVKGAPFSAEAVSESVQVLLDGNRIVRRSTSRLFRDAEGRSRREDLPKQIGLPGAVVNVPESITIYDPVSGLRYSLNPKTNTGRLSTFKSEAELEAERKQKMERDAELKAKFERESGEKVRILNESPKTPAPPADGQRTFEGYKTEMTKIAPKPMTTAAASPILLNMPPLTSGNSNVKIESLGVQNIEGVQAEGTRRITIIPVGAIGNERPIEVVYERWYSKDLQMIVFSKNSDPRLGEQTYRLINVRRSEPPMTLFSPPADYKITDPRRPQVIFPSTPKVSTTRTVPAAARKAAIH